MLLRFAVRSGRGWPGGQKARQDHGQKENDACAQRSRRVAPPGRTMCGRNFSPFSHPLTSFHQNVEPREIDDNLYDLIIVGSGPAGLNAALQAQQLGLNYLTLEAGQLAHGIRVNPASSFYPGYNGYRARINGNLWLQSATKDLLLGKWQSQAQGLSLHLNEPVIDLRQKHDTTWVITNLRRYHTRYTILATGSKRFPFPTNSPDVFIAGRARGAGSISESANQAFDIVEGIAARLGKRQPSPPEDTSPTKRSPFLSSNQPSIRGKHSDPRLYDLVIVGAGATGIEAALQARNAGLPYVLLEKGSVGDTIAHRNPNRVFHHDYGGNQATLKGELIYPDNVKGHELVDLWRQQAHDLNVVPNTRVDGIQFAQGSFSLLTRTANDYKTFHTSNLIVTSGIFNKPHLFNVQGAKGNPRVVYQGDRPPDECESKTVLIIGAGNSAVETALTVTDSNRVILITRHPAFPDNLTATNRQLVESLVRDGDVEVWFECEVDRIDGSQAYLLHNSKPYQLEFGLMLVQLGFERPLDFLKHAGVEVGEFDSVSRDNSEWDCGPVQIAGSLAGSNSIIESANQGYDVVFRMILNQPKGRQDVVNSSDKDPTNTATNAQLASVAIS